MHVVEVPDHKHEEAEGGLERVNQVIEVDEPLRKNHHEERLEPEHETGEAEQYDGKTGGPILELLYAGEPIKKRHLLPDAQVVLDEFHEIAEVLPSEYHLLEKLVPSPREHDREKVIGKCGDQDDCREAVDFPPEEHSTLQPYDPLGEPRIVILEGKAGDAEDDERTKKQCVN